MKNEKQDNNNSVMMIQSLNLRFYAKGKIFYINNGFNVRCDFILYNIHKIISNRYLCTYKVNAILENYNFLYN